MNADRFDALSQFVTSKPHRRGVVRALIGLAAGSGLTPMLAEQTDARKKRKRKKRKPQQEQSCGPCQQRKNGRCSGAQPNGTPCGECGTCLSGVCTPATADTGCGGVCTFCDATARCRVRADDAPCRDDGKCLSGTCNELPTCEPAGGLGDTPCDVAQCCSGRCRVFTQGNTITTACLQGFAGTPCFDSDDCAGELTCVGYRCG